MFLFDTDHIVIAQQRTAPEYGHLMRRVGQHPRTSFHTSIVSFHEQVMGWNAYVARAKDSAGVVRGYRQLERVIATFASAQIASFDAAAADVFNDLRKRRVRVATMDLRIASIALSLGLVVLTRNIVDFGRVPGLLVEDWTIP